MGLADDGDVPCGTAPPPRWAFNRRCVHDDAAGTIRDQPSPASRQAAEHTSTEATSECGPSQRTSSRPCDARRCLPLTGSGWFPVIHHVEGLHLVQHQRDTRFQHSVRAAGLGIAPRNGSAECFRELHQSRFPDALASDIGVTVKLLSRVRIMAQHRQQMSGLRQKRRFMTRMCCSGIHSSSTGRTPAEFAAEGDFLCSSIGG